MRGMASSAITERHAVIASYPPPPPFEPLKLPLTARLQADRGERADQALGRRVFRHSFVVVTGPMLLLAVLSAGCWLARRVVWCRGTCS